MLNDLEVVFGSVLAEHREKKGWSQMKLATKAKLHINAVSNLERGKRKPTLQTVLLLCQALGVPAAKVVAEVEKRTGRL